jgi:Adenine deaminase
VPGFIDAHMHLESSKLLVDEFARLVMPFGTTAVVADPHEIANVLGTDGVHWLIDLCDDIPARRLLHGVVVRAGLALRVAAPCAQPGDLDALLRRRRVIGLAEMMNFPGVVSGAPEELAKLALARHVDGHAPGVLGRALNAYAAAGIGSDHEAYTSEEGRERLRAGMWLLIREATAARNLQALCRCSPSTARTGSRSAPTTASRSTSPRTATSTRWCATRSPSGSRRRRARLRIAQPRALARAAAARRGRARLPRRPARAPRPRDVRA